MTSFLELAQACEALASTTKKLEKIGILSKFLRGLEEEEISPAVLLIVGAIFPEAESKALEIGWRTISKVVEEGQTTLLTKPLAILDVRDYFEKIASARGRDSRRKKEKLLRSLLSQASELERKYILKSIFGEMRIGVSEGVMLEAIARAASVDLAVMRRALMFSGDLGEVAKIALTEGEEGLKKIGIRLFTSVKPMLAEMADSLEDALHEHKRCALEFKYDGARIQIHKKGEEIMIFSRRLTDVTDSLPEVVELGKELKAREAVVEGEVVAVDSKGKPLPFQDLMRRFRRIHEVEKLRKAIPVELHLFDILLLEGRTLVDEAYQKRWSLLEGICPENMLSRRLVTKDIDEAKRFWDNAIKSGHEGLMVKDLDSKYTPGRRGKRWLKVKPSETLDVAIIAAEWGHGRRRGWLSNYHLAVRDEETGEFQMIGKTFKGLTDEEFRWMTEKLQKIKVGEEGGTVYVRPKMMVEVAYNEIQRSPHYRSGYALRFARITRIREDLSPKDADTMDRLKKLYDRQFTYKGKFL
jgi:DNA ligase-1